MPLSLRRKKPSQSTINSASRAVSTPTLLHRLRSSAFNSSKTSFIFTTAYDTVRSRTPPRTEDPPSTNVRLANRKTREYRAIHAGWRISAQRLSKPEQRECLLAAECLNIEDPLCGVLDSPDASIASTVTIPQDGHIPVIHEESFEDCDDDLSPPPPKILYHTLPTATPYRPSPLTSLFHHPAHRHRRPLTSTYTPTRSPLNPTRDAAAKSRPVTPSVDICDHDERIVRPFGSPVMIPLKPPSVPQPRSPTPDRMSSPPTSPGWTHVTHRQYR